MKCKKLLCEYLIPENNRIKFAVVQDCTGCGSGIWFTGIYDSFYEALGRAMFNIYDYIKSYNEKERSKWEISDPYLLEGEGGYGIEVKYDGKTDTMYYILFDGLIDDLYEYEKEE